MTRERSQDDEAIVQLLRAEAGQYRPDPEWILRRVRRETRPRRPPVHGLVPAAIPRWTGRVLVAAVVLAVLVPTGLVLLTPSEPELEPVGSATTGSDPSPAVSPASPPAAEPALDVEVTRAVDTAVTLSPDGAADWVVVGLDPRDPTISARRDVEEQLLDVGVVDDSEAAVEDGPYTAVWRAGRAPLISGDSQGRWLVVAAGLGSRSSGLVVRADWIAGGELVVHAGVGERDGELEVSVDGEVVETATLAAGDDVTPYVVTVSAAGQDGSPAPERVELRLLVSGGGRAGVAAVELTGG